MKKLDKIYETIVFRHWTTSSGGQWSLRKVEQMRGVLWLPQLTLWMKFPGHSQRRDTQTGDFLELRRQIWKFGEVRAIRICREEYRREESCMEKTTAQRQSSKDLQWVLSSLQLNNDKHPCVKNYLRPVEEPPERVGRTIVRVKNSLCSHQPEWNIYNKQGIG